MPNILGDLLMQTSKPIYIHFIHEAPTPHNNYLLDAIATEENIILFRHYLLTSTSVPERPWKLMKSGDVQKSRIQSGYGIYFSWPLVKLALFERKSVFFVIGWESPILILILFILCLRKQPLLMWDDGPSYEAVKLIKQVWRPKQAVKRILICLINRTPGTYFYTGNVKIPSILDLGFSHSKLEKLPFFVKSGTREMRLRDRHQCHEPVTFILAGGRFTLKKGYDILLSALGMIKEKVFLNWKLVLIGSGNEKPKLDVLVEKLKLHQKVDFVDWVEPSTFAAYMHTCDLFVAPARFDRFPTTVIAAMQAGVPVIATDQVGSASEFIESDQNGIIVPAKQPKTLADAIATLINNPLERKRLGLAGQKTIQKWPVERGVQLVLHASKNALKTCVE